MATLGVVVASTREGRVGIAVGEWFVAAVRAHGRVDPTLIDLKELALPMLEERHHPRLRKYEQEKTKAWSATVASQDAFVFVTPEYNHGTPPGLVNALDHVYIEWNYKAAAFVSYGGMSGGIRGVQMTKPILTALKMVPLVEAVAIPFVTRLLDPGTGAFKGEEQYDKAAVVMLDELTRWTGALASMRG
jgi:NAD(P)H-dependent FMN reductase